MTYKIIVSPVASKDLNNALNYYLEEVSKKVATDFFKDYKQTYNALKKNPFYQSHDNNYRFLPFKKFPYIAFFMVDEPSKTVFLNAIFHTSQNPTKHPL